MRPNTIEVTVIPNQLSAKMLEQLWTIYNAYYPRSKQVFLSLHKRFNFIALYSINGQFIGFTGLKMNTITWEGKTIKDVYVGQTIMKRLPHNTLLRLTAIKSLLEELRVSLNSDAHIWCSAIRYEPFILSTNNRDLFYISPQKQQRIRLNGMVDYLQHTNYGDSYTRLAFSA